MRTMLPGNSFPQIGVVSVNECVGNGELLLDHRGSVALSNHYVYSFANSDRELHRWGVELGTVGGLEVGVWVDLAECVRVGVGQQRAFEGAHGQLDAVVGAGFAHEAAHVGLYGSLLNSQLERNLSIGMGLQNQVQYLLFAVCQVRIVGQA